MAKRKLSLLVQAMNIFAQLDERDRQTLADYVRSQTQALRKPTAKKKKEPVAVEVAKRMLTEAAKHQHQILA